MENDFRFFRLDTGARLALAGSLFLAGVAVGIVSDNLVAPAFVLSAVGWTPLMLKKITNRPDDQGLEEWRAVSMAEVDRLDDAMRATTKTMAKSGEILIKVFGTFILALILFAAMAGFVAGRRDIGFVLAEAGIFLVPALLFGRLVLHKPKEIAFKMPSFRALLRESIPAKVTVTPYIRFDKDSKGADVPEDLRVMYETKRGPADFVGIQVQCAKNKGPNGEVPYLYAVILTKGRSGATYRQASNLESPGFVVETGGDEEYGTVVIRQATEGKGYHTTTSDCAKLGRLCGQIAARFAADLSPDA